METSWVYYQKWGSEKIKSIGFKWKLVRQKNNNVNCVIEDRKPMEYFKIEKFSNKNLRTRNHAKTTKTLFVTVL